MPHSAVVVESVPSFVHIFFRDPSLFECMEVTLEFSRSNGLSANGKRKRAVVHEFRFDPDCIHFDMSPYEYEHVKQGRVQEQCVADFLQKMKSKITGDTRVKIFIKYNHGAEEDAMYVVESCRTVLSEFIQKACDVPPEQIKLETLGFPTSKKGFRRNP